MKNLIAFALIFTIILFVSPLVSPAFGQMGPLVTISRPIQTWQADWYTIEITQFNQSMEIFFSHPVAVDDMGLLLYENDISEIYDPETNFQPVASGRNYWYSNTILVAFPNVPPGVYTMSILAFNVMSAEQTTYSLESNIPLDYLGTTHFMDLSVDGLEDTYPTTVTWDFLGKTYTQETSDQWFMWADDGSTFKVEKIIPIDSSERFRANNDGQWTVVQYEVLEVTYFRQFLSTISLLGLDSPIDFSFTSGGKVTETEIQDSWSDWVDDGRSLVLPRVIEQSPSERYITTDDVVIQVNQPVNHLIDYTHQWLVSISQNTNVDVPISTSFLGNLENHVINDKLSLWIDDDSDISIPQIISPKPLHRWILDSNLLTINSASPIEIIYQEQVKPTIITSGLNSNYPASITYTSQGQTYIESSSSIWSNWIDSVTSINIEQQISGKSGEKWISKDLIINPVDNPVVFNINYVHESLVSLLFTDANQNTILEDLPSNIEIINPDGTISSLTSYSNIWLADGTYTIKNIDYQGLSFSPISSRNFNPTAGQSWIIPLSLHDLTFNVKDQVGFSVSDADVLLTMPNGLKIMKQTDDSGEVIFNLVPNGEYNIQVSKFGLSRSYSGNVSNDSSSYETIKVLFSSSTILIVLLLIVLISIAFVSESPTLNKSVKKNFKNLLKSFKN
tara:strand:- start:13230 stop:15257 length:2028 start_codon:yes stop_codon:yes gene_type:complete